MDTQHDTFFACWVDFYTEKLILGGNDLSGTLPASIGSLPNLEKIELSDNEFTGILPDTIMNGTSLSKWSQVHQSRVPFVYFS
jgi:hypothetical protein